MAQRIIALTGKAGSGKSTVAQILQERGFRLVKFADPLKNMLRSYYRDTIGLTPCDIERRIEGDLKEEPCVYLSGKSPRFAMQTLGTEWGRDCLSDQFWVDCWTSKVAAIRTGVVVDDCRFPNEAKRIRELGGTIWHISREGVGTASVHTSESGIEAMPGDIGLPNEGTVEALRRKVYMLV